MTSVLLNIILNGVSITGVDKGGPAPHPNGRAKKNLFVKIEGLSS